MFATRKISAIFDNKKNIKMRFPMEQNITLSIDKKLIVRAKILATRRLTSISKMLAEDLKTLVEESERYDTANPSF
jgi:hypothetical protein